MATDASLYAATNARASQPPLLPAAPSGCDAPLAERRVVEACWAQNPRARPSAGDLLQKLVVLAKQLG
jgi:hypothetical protein